MKSALDKRLQVLEARPPKVAPEHDRRYSATIKAMFDTLPHAGKWAPSKVAPFNWIEMESDMELLWNRHKAGALTDADHDLMNAWPKCHLEPLVMVKMLVRLTKEI